MHDSTPSARRFYDRISRVYDAIADASEHAAREKGLELLNVQPGERVLEIGYGTGHSLEQLAVAVGDDGRVLGVDISPGMRDVARERLARAGVAHRVDPSVAEVPPLDYGDRSVDVVTMSFTLELFREETIPSVLAEVRRVLVPGGRVGTVSMATSPPDRPDGLLERGYKWAHHHFPHIVDCRPIDAQAVFERAGLEITERAELSIWTLPVVALVGRNPSPSRRG